MTQTVSHFEAVITLPREIPPANAATAQAIGQYGSEQRAVNDDYLERVRKSDRLGQATQVPSGYSARRFEDQRCPVCGGLGCGGC